jgi:glutamin-(asparagin-)ase
VVLAGAPESAGKGVLISMNDEIHTARDVAKRNSFKTDTFASPYGPLGYVVEGKPFFYRLAARPHTVQTEFDIERIDTLPRVDIVYGYANVDGTAYAAFAAAGAKAIVNAGTGNANFSDNVLPALQKLREAGVFVVRSARVGSGSFYRSSFAGDEKNGWIVADDQTPQKARILMALALTRTSDLAEIRRIFMRY